MNGSVAAAAIAFAVAAGVDYHSISFTIYISVVSAPLRSCATLYFVIIIIVIIFSRRCVSCRGSLNRSMCCTRSTRSTSFAICRFVLSISYARALSLRPSKIGRDEVRWQRGCAAGWRSVALAVLSLLFLWEDEVPSAFTLLMGIAYTRF